MRDIEYPESWLMEEDSADTDGGRHHRQHCHEPATLFAACVQGPSLVKTMGHD